VKNLGFILGLEEMKEKGELALQLISKAVKFAMKN